LKLFSGLHKYKFLHFQSLTKVRNLRQCIHMYFGFISTYFMKKNQILYFHLQTNRIGDVMVKYIG